MLGTVSDVMTLSIAQPMEIAFVYGQSLRGSSTYIASNHW